MKHLYLFILICICTIGVAHVTYAQADSGTIARLVDSGCGTSTTRECGLSDFLGLINRTITFIVSYILVPIIIIVILRAGLKLVIYSDKASARTEAKQSLIKAFLGFFFIIAAWMLVSTVIGAFGVKVSNDPTQGVWNLLGK